MGVSVRHILLALLVAVGLVWAVASVGPASAQRVRVVSTPSTRPLRTGLLDPHAFAGSQRATAFAMAAAAGVSYVRIPVLWRTVAPATEPAGFVPSDPDSPGYRWSLLDSEVSDADADGLTPILDVTATPQWAFRIPAHGWRAGTPKANALHNFAKALATRYDGSGGGPEAHVFQVWNEPNLSLDLSPVKASTYRRMVNAVAAAVHGVDPANLVVAGGLDPFQNVAPRFRTVAPLTFMRHLLCLSKGRHPHKTCSATVDFDVWSHHPYTFDGPFGHARLPGDVSLGDLPEMRALLRAGLARHRIVHAHPVQFWVTEFGWDTNPPRRGGVPLGLDARWAAESLYQMWRSGVSLATWYLLEDQPKPSRFQSGLYFHSASLASARAKPMRAAIRFPFVAYRRPAGAVRIWGRDATSSSALVTIRRRRGRTGPWRTVGEIRANRWGIFEATLRLATTKRDWLRASAAGSGPSLAFSLTVPPARRYGPWGN